jgi:hypothetical protein
MNGRSNGRLRRADRRRRRPPEAAPGAHLPDPRVALLLVLLGVLGVLFWPAWSANARRRRLGIMTALAGDDGP